MRSTDSATLLQQTFKMSHNILTSGKQFEGVYYGTVVQTDASNPGPITAGNMTFTIPSLSGNNVWGPLPYPGETAPPNGTTCSVGFGPNNQPVILGFVGWSGGGSDSGWSNASLGNSFVSAGVTPGYRLLNGVVYMRGNMQSGSAGNTAFTLPSKYRPAATMVIPCQQYGTANLNYVTINTDGTVVPNASSAWLSGVAFPVN